MSNLQSQKTIILISFLLTIIKTQKTGLTLEKPDADFKKFLLQGISSTVCRINIYKGEVNLQEKVDQEEINEKIVQLEIKKDNSSNEQQNYNKEIEKKIEDLKNKISDENSGKKTDVKNGEISDENLQTKTDDLEKGQILEENINSVSKIVKDDKIISLLLSCTIPNSKNLESRKFFGNCENVDRINFKNNENNFFGKSDYFIDVKEFFTSQENEKVFYYLDKMGKSDDNDVRVISENGKCEIYFDGKAFVKAFSLFFGFFVMIF